MKKGFFITGTDTGVGKTRVAVALLKKLKAKGYRTAGLKPISSGCIQTAQGLRNADALSLQSAASEYFPYEWINPFAFAPPIAPHIAAKEANCHLNVNTIWTKCQPLLNTEVDYVVVEGAGGLLVPLNSQETMVDLARKIQFPVILVIGLRLGCISHSLLTEAYLETDRHRHVQTHPMSLRPAGWVGYALEPEMSYISENISTLQQQLKMPFLGIYPDFKIPEVEQFQCNLLGLSASSAS